MYKSTEDLRLRRQHSDTARHALLGPDLSEDFLHADTLVCVSVTRSQASASSTLTHYESREARIPRKER